MPAWTITATGIDLAVRVTPRSGRDLLAAGTPDYFAARLAAAPVEGAANAALIALVAKAFAIPRRDVALIAGETSRLKRMRLTGAPQALAEIAAALYEPKP